MTGFDSIDDVVVDCDEDGFHLILAGDFQSTAEKYVDTPTADGFNLRLPQDAALKLLKEVSDKIGEWAHEGAEALLEYKAHTARGDRLESGRWVTGEED